MNFILFVLVLLSLVYYKNTNKIFTDLNPTIILISLDGFHPAYLEKHKNSHLNQIAKEGIRAKWMTPVFPTKTFPNHYSIVTGLYPENHGIIHNTIYDPAFKSIFSLGKREEVQNARWWQGEPIWVTAEKSGLKTAPFFFPGSEAAIAGIRPAFWQAYNGSMPNSDRVDQVLKLLDFSAAERPQFFSLYFSDLDDVGHNFATSSKEVKSSIAGIDNIIGRLINGLKERDIYDKVNPGNIIILDDYFNKENAEVIIWDDQLTGIFPKKGKEAIIYNELKNENPGHVSIFHKSKIPDRFHYNNNPRIPAIICLANEGWVIMNRSDFENKQRNNWFSTTTTGAHGYDNQLESMRAIFLAKRPSI